MRETSVAESIGPVACRSCDLFQVCAAIDALPASLDLPRCPTLRVLEAGEVLHTAGTAANHVYALRKGMLKSERVAPHGDDRIIQLHVPGEVLGEEGMRAGRYMSTVKAITPVMVCELPFRDIAKRGSLSLQAGLFALADSKPAPASRRPGRAQDRLHNFARDLVRRLHAHGVTPAEIALEIPRYELAEMLGISIDSLRRALNHTEPASAIKVQGKQLIVSA